MSRNTNIVIAAYDGPLIEDIRTALMPHFGEDEAELHASFLDSWTLVSVEGIVLEQRRLSEKLRHASLMVVGFTGICERDYWAILSAQLAKRPCGLILRTQDRAKIAALSVIHHCVPFRFVVAVGTIRSKQLAELFPDVPFLCDITSLIEPGKQIARFIAARAADVLAEARTN